MRGKYKYNFIGTGYFDLYNVRDKDKNSNNYIAYMLARTQQMFKYTGLPDTIPQRMLELYLQTNGCCCIAKYNDELYAFIGGFGGEPDPYYRPTIYTVANPALNFSKNYVIDEDCVIVLNDSMLVGLLPMNARYANALTENDITLHLIDINARTSSLISAADDRTKLSGEKYVQDLEDGKPGIIAETAFFDGIRVQPYSNYASSHVTDFIEYEQYLKASWFNELGLQSNYNMKRESINSNEAQLNEDALLPLVDDMLAQRQRCFDKVNDMFGTEIKVELNSSWRDNQIEISLEHQSLDSESPDQVDPGVESVDERMNMEVNEDDENSGEIEGLVSEETIQEKDPNEEMMNINEKLEVIDEKLDNITEELSSDEKSEESGGEIDEDRETKS